MSRFRRFVRENFHAVVPGNIKSQIIQEGRYAVGVIDRWVTNRGKEKPIAIDLETNSDCTRDCHYCARDSSLDDILQEDTVHDLIDQLVDWEFKGRLSFHSFNEPLTDERILGFYQYASEYLSKTQIEVFTNGDLLTPRLLEDLLDIGVDRIYVTNHEPTPQAQVDRLSDF